MSGSRWNAVLVVCLAGFVAACGSSSTTKVPECAPRTCAAAGASCGELPDGCGGMLACGSCPAGQTCGGGGPNVCGAAACQPKTCAGLGKSCGPVSDGCSAVLDCGTCPPGQVCGAGGVENVCGTPACVPTSCAAQGKGCGSIPDGCGGTLACGDCPAGQTCGGGGTPNVCAAPAPVGGVRWSFVVSTPGPDLALDAGVDGLGNRYLLTATMDESGPTQTLRLDKLSKDGKALLRKEWSFEGYPLGSDRAFKIAVAPAGEVYLAVSQLCPDLPFCTPARSIDLGGGTVTASVLVKLSAEGAFAWQRSLGSDAVNAVSADDQASVLVARQSVGSPSGSVEKYRSDGVRLWRVDDAPGLPGGVGWPSGGALDPGGSALVTIVYSADGSGTTASIRTALRKIGLDGAIAWTTLLPGASVPDVAVGATEKGTGVVLARRSGDVAFGGSTVTSGGLVLYAVEADGSPRWAFGIEALHAPRLAVDRTGRAVVAGQGGNCGAVVAEAVNLAGAELWRRTIPADSSACWRMGPLAVAAYGADHEPFVGGAFTGEVTIGDQTYSPQATDAFGAELAP